MSVDAILKRKGRHVETTTADALVLDVVKQMTEKKIGAVVVCQGNDRIIGILSERDIVRTVAEQGPSALERSVADIMTGEPVTCSPQDSINQVMEVMTERRFRHMPVKDGKSLVGIVTIGDLVKQRLDDTEYEVNVLREYVHT